MIDLAASALIFLGSFFIFSAALGLIRMPDALSRIQVATKATRLGAMLILIGLAVRYPGRADHPHHAVNDRQMSAGGKLIALSLDGDRETAFRFLDRLRLIDISNNLGDSKTLACHPASTTHRALSEEERAAMGLDESWVRLSIGLEDARDLEKDLTCALDGL